MEVRNKMTKAALHAACLAFIEQRIAAARTAMRAAQESSSSETKSSKPNAAYRRRSMATSGKK